MKNMKTIFLMLALLMIVMSLFVLTNESDINENIREVKARIVDIDNSNVINSGLAQLGNQILEIEIIEGNYEGKKVEAMNQFIGQLELDTFYKKGDKIIAALSIDNNEIVHAKALELYRQNWLIAMFSLFILCLIIYARIIGLKALFSFVASLYLIWEFLIPGLLEGQNPLLLTSLILSLLSAIIIFAVAGFTKKGIAAFFGTIFGLFVTIFITMFFGDKLVLNGMTSSYAQNLLFSGYQGLNMRHIFYAAVIIGASGAAMDIAMDVSASMAEIKDKKPDINIKELVQSGFNVGRAVIGTMTTTLLLAYSGGYLTLIMLFMAKNSSMVKILNMKIVVAEIMRTVVGSIGLVLVAPITAVFAGWILTINIQEMFSRQKNSD